MVSAVHLRSAIAKLTTSSSSLQRGCTWLVQFIRYGSFRVSGIPDASKGLHMVSAVHHRWGWRRGVGGVASKGLHMVSAVHPSEQVRRHQVIFASKGLHMVSAVHL